MIIRADSFRFNYEPNGIPFGSCGTNRSYQYEPMKKTCSDKNLPVFFVSRNIVNPMWHGNNGETGIREPHK